MIGDIVMTEMQLRASVFEDLNAILDNEDAVCEQEAMTEDEKTEILEDIREGLREVKAARKGKITMQSARDFLHEIRS